jgi:hypothetical protein
MVNICYKELIIGVEISMDFKILRYLLFKGELDGPVWSKPIISSDFP